MLKRMVVFCLIAMLITLLGCAAHIHKIGSGPQGDEVVKQRQWYVLWGLVPINEVDTAEMAGGAANYQIQTEMSPTDVLINIFTSVVSVSSRTVTVAK